MAQEKDISELLFVHNKNDPKAVAERSSKLMKKERRRWFRQIRRMRTTIVAVTDASREGERVLLVTIL